MSYVREYMFDIWHRNTYKQSDNFPLVSGSPVQSFAFLFATYGLFRIISFIRNSKYDLRPFVLIFNGFMFGVYTVGAMIVVFWLSNWGRLFTECSPPAMESKNVREFFTDYCIYLFFCLKFVDIIMKMTFALFDKSSKSVSTIVLAKMMFDILHAYIILKFYPGGVIMLTPVIDVVVSAIDFGHQTLLSASPELRPLLKRGTFLLCLRTVQNFTCLLHIIYYLTQPTCASSPFILLFQAAYNSICFVYHSAPLTYRGVLLSK